MKFVHAEYQCSRGWLKRTIGETFNQRDGISGFFDDPQPTQVGPHDADKLVAHFFGMHDGASSRRQQPIQLGEEHATPFIDVVAGK